MSCLTRGGLGDTGQMIRQHILSNVLVFSLAMFGCGTWIGNPGDAPSEDGEPKKLALTMAGSGKQAPIIPLSNGNILIKEIWGSIENFTLVDSKGVHSSLEFKGPFVYDFMNNAFYPTLNTFEVTSGEYDTIEFTLTPFVKGSIDGVPAELEANTILSKFIIDIDETSSEAPLAVNRVETIKATRNSVQGPIKLENQDQRTLIVDFDPTNWFEGLKEKTVEANQLVEEVSDIIVKNAGPSMSFGVDNNGNGFLDADE